MLLFKIKPTSLTNTKVICSPFDHFNQHCYAIRDVGNGDNVDSCSGQKVMFSATLGDPFTNVLHPWLTSLGFIWPVLHNEFFPPTVSVSLLLPENHNFFQFPSPPPPLPFGDHHDTHIWGDCESEKP